MRSSAAEQKEKIAYSLKNNKRIRERKYPLSHYEYLDW